ncbi:hypothetical protein ACSUZJ_07315 [Telluria sp. B2]
MNNTRSVTIQLDDETYKDLLAVVDACNFAHTQRGGGNTHGKLDVPRLLLMLAEDAAMTKTRPGSWEGANMQRVLDSHGYS